MENRTQTASQEILDNKSNITVFFENGDTQFFETTEQALKCAYNGHLGEEVILIIDDIEMYNIELSGEKAYVISEDQKIKVFDTNQEAYEHVKDKLWHNPAIVIETGGNLCKTDSVGREFLLGKGEGFSPEDLFDENSDITVPEDFEDDEGPDIDIWAEDAHILEDDDYGWDDDWASDEDCGD